MITANMVDAAIKGLYGVTFASCISESVLSGLSAKHKGSVIKTSYMHGLVFVTLRDIRNAYEKAVRAEVGNFFDVSPASWFYHDPIDSYAIVRKRSDRSKAYLCMLPRGGNSKYRCAIAGTPLTFNKVLSMCTESTQKKMTSNEVFNKANNVVHHVQCRTIALDNILQLKIAGKILT